MPVIITRNRVDREQYVVEEDSGREVGIFEAGEAGLAQATEACMRVPEKRRGRMYILVPADLAPGYAIFCVIDFDNGCSYFVIATPSGVLDKAYASFSDAFQAAILLVPPDEPSSIAVPGE